MHPSFPQPIYVTKPFLPSIEDYSLGLEKIWANAWLTNDGPLLRRFVAALERHQHTTNLSVFTNGTLALQLALRALEITGEVITTPFTFVATAHALSLCGIQPVFADIEPTTYTLDPAAVEAAITPRTTAILAVHVYGHPCQLHALSAIARRHHLRLIYDAAHAFGVTVDGTPISHFGDASMFSFHATKLFHSIEGGMLTFADPALLAPLHYLRNFGIANEVEVNMVGTNAKMNEFQALMGLLVLRHLPDIIARRRMLTECYRTHLAGVPGILLPPALPSSIEYNYAYLPIQVCADDCSLHRDALYEELKRYNIVSRRYFYPLLTDMTCYRDHPTRDPLTVARHTANQILCLPLYHDLSTDEVTAICDIIRTLVVQSSPVTVVPRRRRFGLPA